MKYRVYVTDSLQNIGKGVGCYITTRYADSIHIAQKDNRTGDEIAADVIKRAGLEVIACGSV